MNLHPRNRVLLKPHGWNKETMDYVLRPQMQVYAVADGKNHRRSKNVVASGRIAGINAQRIAFFRPGKLLGVRSTKNSVSSGVAEIPLKLRSGDLNFDLTSLLLRGYHA